MASIYSSSRWIFAVGWLYIPEIPGASNEVIPKQFEKFRIA